MSELTIEHTDTEGTILYGTARGDGSAEILKVRRWRWGRSIAAWYIPRSRDQAPMRARITGTVEELEANGFSVAVSIDATPGNQEDAEERRAERGSARAERLQNRAERHEGTAQEHDLQSHRISDGIPMGQPILVGHHSQRRHERDLERIHRHDSASLEHSRQAQRDRAAAESATRTKQHRESPVTVANRIERLAADLRRDERVWVRLTDTERAEGTYGPQVAERIAYTRAELEYWESIRAAQIDSGVATNYGPGTVTAGDLVKIGGRWCKVARANAKTVSVQTSYSWTDRAPWHKVQDHKSATAEDGTPTSPA